MRANDTVCLARSLNRQCRPKDHAGFLATEEGDRGRRERNIRRRDRQRQGKQIQKDGEYYRRERQCARELFLELNSLTSWGEREKERETEKGGRRGKRWMCVDIHT